MTTLSKREALETGRFYLSITTIFKGRVVELLPSATMSLMSKSSSCLLSSPFLSTLIDLIFLSILVCVSFLSFLFTSYYFLFFALSWNSFLFLSFSFFNSLFEKSQLPMVGLASHSPELGRSMKHPSVSTSRLRWAVLHFLATFLLTETTDTGCTHRAKESDRSSLL